MMHSVFEGQLLCPRPGACRGRLLPPRTGLHAGGLDPGEKETGDPTGEVVIDQIPGRVRIEFTLPVNPLTVLRGGVRLQGPDGAPVRFTAHTGLGRREMILGPATSVSPLTVILDGVESLSGRRLPRTVRRP